MEGNLQGLFKEKKWTKMAGTEGTYKYVVIAATSLARIGVRNLGKEFRVRIEPTSEFSASMIGRTLTKEAGYKQPGDNDQDRFSIVVSKDQLAETLQAAIAAIKPEIVYNPKAAAEYIALAATALA